MVLQYGIKLALHLISAHFGDLVSKVCECLLRRGTLTYQDIIRYSELSPQLVKNCLLVLIQHNCVQAFDVEKEGAAQGAPAAATTHYTAIFENIVHRMRFAKFLAIISEELGEECEELLEGLLQHGRLTLEQILDRYKQSDHAKQNGCAEQSEGNATAEDTVRANFDKLVKAHYVERCPASAPFIALPTEDEAPAGRRGSKSAKFAKVETVEQRAIAAAIRPESDRFSVISDSMIDVSSEARTHGKHLNVTAGGKRKHEALETDEGIMSTICEKEALWRANFEEFVRRLREKTCVTHVRSHLDDGAGIVLNAMLEATRSTEKNVRIANTVPLSIDSIWEEVIKCEEGRSMTLDHVRAALGQLGCYPIAGETDDTFSADIKKIIETAQNDEVESTVKKRYGIAAYSIFRLLSKSGRLLESDKISDTALLEKKIVLTTLYNLWKDNFLLMQKVEAQGAQSKEKQFLMWKVNKDSLKEHILDDMYHAVLNLSKRIAYELEKEQEIINLPSDKRNSNKRYGRIKTVKILLDASVMKLDDVLMLFHDF